MESSLKQLELHCVLNTIFYFDKGITKKEMNSVKNWLYSGIDERE